MRFSFGKSPGAFPAEIHTRTSVFSIERDIGLFVGRIFIGFMVTKWNPKKESALAPRVTTTKRARGVR